MLHYVEPFIAAFKMPAAYNTHCFSVVSEISLNLGAYINECTNQDWAYRNVN